MITLYSGTPGSGKSLNTITVALRALRWGKYVIANYPIKFTEKEIKKGYDKRFFYKPNDDITVDNLIIFAITRGMIEKGKESQAVVIIDEAGGKFNCRNFRDESRTSWIDFFSQHRKAGYDFVLVAQNDRMIDRQIRGYIEIEKRHRKINNFGPFWILPLKVFCAIEYWYVAKQRVSSEFFIYRKSLGNRYDSMKMFSGFTMSAQMLKRIEQIKNKENLDEPTEELKQPISAIYTEDK